MTMPRAREPNEMVMRVAMALKDVTLEDLGFPCDDINFCAIARAAIAAMREPTEAMIRAGALHDEETAAPWHAMIDEALAPQDR